MRRCRIASPPPCPFTSPGSRAWSSSSSIGTVRPINLGALALVMTFLVGTLVVGESAREMYRGFPVDLLVLLAGVTYLFGVAATNGTVERIVEGAARLVQGRRALIPWIVFCVASLPAMAGALGSAGVAMLAPLSMRLAERYAIDRRMIGLMVVHGAAAGNFSPLNVLSAIVTQAVATDGLADVGVGAVPRQPRVQRRARRRDLSRLRRPRAAASRLATTVDAAGSQRWSRAQPDRPPPDSIRSGRSSRWRRRRRGASSSVSTSASSRSAPRRCSSCSFRHPARAPTSGSPGASCCSCAAS